MTDLKAAAQQALEALGLWATGRDMDAVALNDLIFRLEAALAEPVQEPVAWYHVPYPNNGISPMVSLSKHHEPSMYGAAVPLYLSPIMEPKIKTPKEEPVAWMDIDENGNRLTVRQWSDGNREEVPLYTAPPQRKPLPEDEIALIVADCSASAHRHDDFSFARAIERAHGIGV